MDGKNRVKKLINKLWKTDKIWADADFKRNFSLFGKLKKASFHI
jgi:hypothetical protein